MIRVRCPKCGLSYPKSAGHRCPDGSAPPLTGNANIPFDYAAWRKRYMRDYMRRYRRLVKAGLKPKAQAEEEDA